MAARRLKMADKKDKKADPKMIAYIAGGAVAGGAIGYIIHRVGFKKIVALLKEKNIIPENISSMVENFDLKSFSGKINNDVEDSSGE